MNFSVKVNLRTASSTSSALGIEKFFANRCLGFSFTVAKAIRTYEKGYEYTNGYENFRSDSYIRKIRIFVYLLNDECEKGCDIESLATLFVQNLAIGDWTSISSLNAQWTGHDAERLARRLLEKEPPYPRVAR